MMNKNEGKEILNTFKNMCSMRSLLETNWDDAYRYTFPLRGQNILNKNGEGYSNANNAFSEQAQIFDSTGSDAARLLASSMISGLTPANSQWFNLIVPESEGPITQESKEWLQRAAGILFKAIHSSNYDSEAFEFMIDMVVGGIAGLHIEEDVDGELLFESWPLDSLYVAETMKRKKIDTLYRTLAMTSSQAVAKFGKQNLPHNILNNLLSGDSDKKYTFIHCIRPRLDKNGKQTTGVRKKTMPFSSIYVCKESCMVVHESGYHEFPTCIPRWLNIPKTPYAVGPIDTALPDIKTINRVVQMMLSNAEMAIAGTFVMKNDGVLNPNTVRIGPRKVIVAADVNNIKNLNSGGDFGIASAEIARLQRQIKAVLMSDQLTPENRAGQMTATEVRVRVQLIRQMLGPVYGRFQSEFLQPLIVRTFGLMHRAGKFGDAPEELIDMKYVPKYDSPLARAQRLEEVQAQDEFEFNIAQMAGINPEILDLYDFDKAARTKAEKMGVALELFKTDDEVLKIRKDRSQQKAQAIANEQLLQEQLNNEGNV